MTSRFTRRQVLLAAALLVTLAATVATWWQEHAAVPSGVEMATPVERPAPAVVTGTAIASPARQPTARDLTDPTADIFAVAKQPAVTPEAAQTGKAIVAAPPPSISPPPPPAPVVPQPPAKPTAPPLPFVFIGKLGDEAGQYTVFVSARGRNFAIKAGDTLLQQYRVDDIRPPTMTLTYLPLSIQQTMSIGEPN